MDYNELIVIHQNKNGQCDNCGQKCDKRVVHILLVDLFNDSQLLCPDCKNNNERPFFSATDDIIKVCSKYTNWDKEQTKLFLETIPLGIALINFNENTREYWNWDKSKFIKKIEALHDGTILSVSYHTKPRIKEVTIDKKTYKIKNRENRTLKKIQIPSEFENAKPTSNRIQQVIIHYKKYGKFSNSIFVTRPENSKKDTLLNGYESYLAALEMELKTINVMVVEKN